MQRLLADADRWIGPQQIDGEVGLVGDRDIGQTGGGGILGCESACPVIDVNRGDVRVRVVPSERQGEWTPAAAEVNDGRVRAKRWQRRFMQKHGGSLVYALW